jgi:hypothetical protein
LLVANCSEIVLLPAGLLGGCTPAAVARLVRERAARCGGQAQCSELNSSQQQQQQQPGPSAARWNLAASTSLLRNHHTWCSSIVSVAGFLCVHLDLLADDLLVAAMDFYL